jgi:hypothetical protein
LIPAEQVESIEIMKGAVPYMVQVQQQELSISPKKSRKESNCGTAYMNIGTQTTDRD